MHIYDPMCSWCWGYRNTWLELSEQLDSLVDIQYRVGGLAPDNDHIMPSDMQQFLQQTWHKIAQQLGTSFNFDFWALCTPKRSTYPACRAVIIAREYGVEQEMLYAIQSAYYLQAQNPSELETLTRIAKDIGLDSDVFKQKLASDEVNQKLMQEISLVRTLPIQGFPSLILQIDQRSIAIPIDYLNADATLANIKQYL